MLMSISFEGMESFIFSLSELRCHMRLELRTSYSEGNSIIINHTMLLYDFGSFDCRFQTICRIGEAHNLHIFRYNSYILHHHQWNAYLMLKTEIKHPCIP